jgi:class 3 adenylate cyclase
MAETTDSQWRPRPASPTSASRGTERAVQIVDEVLARAGAEGGRAFSIARAAASALFLVRELIWTSFEKRELFIVGALAVALVVSVVQAVVAPRLSSEPRHVWWRRFFDTVFDATLFFVIMLALVLAPYPSYRGLFVAPFVYTVALIIAESGLRSDRAFVWLSFAINGVGLLVLAALEKALWPLRAQWQPSDSAFIAIIVLASTFVGLASASHGRNLALRGARRALEAMRAREKLGAYVGFAVANEAMAADEIVLGGKRQRVAVLFSDLRGFTATAEHMAPEELVAQLNAYLDVMVRVIHDAGGVVDKYIGDGIMAVFGAPRERPDDASRALGAARAMQARLAVHNEERKRRGLAPLAMGIGVHYGVAIAGHIGTVDHAQYTIVGDVVNVAARLEGLTKEQGVDVLVSRELLDAARAIAPVNDVEARGELALRGRTQALDVFSLT